MAKTKRVLIPTDFTVGSLQIVFDYLAQSADEPVDVVLVCGQSMSDSISELLGFSKDDYLSKVQSSDFLKACQLLRTRFEHKLVDLYADVIYGSQDRYIRNYLKGGRIDVVVMPHAYTFSKVDKTQEVMRAIYRNIRIETQKLVSIDTVNTHEGQLDKVDHLFFRKGWNVTY